MRVEFVTPVLYPATCERQPTPTEGKIYYGGVVAGWIGMILSIGAGVYSHFKDRNGWALFFAIIAVIAIIVGFYVKRFAGAPMFEDNGCAAKLFELGEFDILTREGQEAARMLLDRYEMTQTLPQPHTVASAQRIRDVGLMCIFFWEHGRTDAGRRNAQIGADQQIGQLNAIIDEARRRGDIS
jgi:MFS family permease